MKAKKIASIILLLALICTLCACSGKTESISDGDYTVDVTLSGGSGRAGIDSPAKLHVEGGNMTAEIVWSSKNYDYMIACGEKILPTSMEPGSTFLIPVAALDEEIPVTADTVAMSTPHEIDYTLVFNSASLKNVK